MHNPDYLLWVQFEQRIPHLRVHGIESGAHTRVLRPLGQILVPELCRVFCCFDYFGLLWDSSIEEFDQILIEFHYLYVYDDN